MKGLSPAYTEYMIFLYLSMSNARYISCIWHFNRYIPDIILVNFLWLLELLLAFIDLVCRCRLIWIGCFAGSHDLSIFFLCCLIWYVWARFSGCILGSQLRLFLVREEMQPCSCVRHGLIVHQSASLCTVHDDVHGSHSINDLFKG